MGWRDGLEGWARGTGSRMTARGIGAPLRTWLRPQCVYHPATQLCPSAGGELPARANLLRLGTAHAQPVSTCALVSLTIAWC